MSTARIIDGKAISLEIRGEIADKTNAFKEKYGMAPGLAVIIVGSDPASGVYVRNKKRACEQVGFYSRVYELDEDTTEKRLEALIDELNGDDEIHGILVQLPLPAHIDEERVLLRISPDKDVDAFHPYNVGMVTIGDPRLLPCTPSGIIQLLKRSDIEISGKECVVVGRSNIVGKPMALMLTAENGTVTICHSKTKNIGEVCRRADILVSAVGRAKFITSDMVKNGAVVIDVGMNRDEDGKLVGDVDFDSVSSVASYITPVPGGVGPMTVTMLLENTLRAAEALLKNR